ncbi:MAG: MFS transporter [Acetobacteraceae bacterium]|nr:MFS transporter [Acetobacteraceae bacterium]
MDQETPRARLGLARHLALSVYWFSLNFHWGSLLTVVISTQMLRFVAEAEKGRALGLTLAMGALVAMLVQPLMGAISDRSTFRWGRRRPYLLTGTLLNAAGLLALAYATGLWWLFGAYLFVQFANNMAGSPYQGLIPDLVPPEQRGTASGFMGLMSMLGSIGGVLLAGLFLGQGWLVHFYWLVMAVIMVGMALTCIGVKEERLAQAPPFDWRSFLAGFWVSPRRHPDFAWLWATRFLVMLGFYSLLPLINYYLKDVLQMANFAQATSTVSAVVMVGATLSSLASGWASDRLGRRALVCAAGLLMGSTCLALLFAPPFWVILAFGVVFGLGYGSFISVDWALAVDVLPSLGSAARDLGIWSIAVTMPQVVGPLISGPLIDTFNRLQPLMGYRVVFALAFLYLLLGSVGVWRIRGAR